MQAEGGGARRARAARSGVAPLVWPTSGAAPATAAAAASISRVGHAQHDRAAAGGHLAAARPGPRRRRPASRSARGERAAEPARADDAHAGALRMCWSEFMCGPVHSAVAGSGRLQGYPSGRSARPARLRSRVVHEPHRAAERREALVDLYQEARAARAAPSPGPHQGGVRRRQRRRRPDVRGRGAGPAGGPSGPALRGPGRQAARPAAGEVGLDRGTCSSRTS